MNVFAEELQEVLVEFFQTLLERAHETIGHGAINHPMVESESQIRPCLGHDLAGPSRRNGG